MPLISGRDLHIDAVLSNIMVGRRPNGYIADQLVPTVNVGKQSNIYYKSNYKENFLTVPDLDRRAKGAESREVYFSTSSDTYYAKNYALGTKWFDEDVVNADDPIRLRQRSAQHVTDVLKNNYESRIAALANVSTNVSTTFHVLTPWTNTTGSRPFDDLANMIELFRATTTLMPNVAVIPEQVQTYVRRSDQLRDLLFGDRGGLATDQAIANLLNIDRILVPKIFVNTADPYATKIGSGTLAPAWGNKVFLAYVGDLDGQEVDTWMTAFRWTDPSFGTPWAIRAFEHKGETRSQKIEASYYQDEKIISADLGLAIDSVA